MGNQWFMAAIPLETPIDGILGKDPVKNQICSVDVHNSTELLLHGWY